MIPTVPDSSISWPQAVVWIAVLALQAWQIYLARTQSLKIDKVAEQTNGMASHLVRVTGESEKAKGKLEAQAEEKVRRAQSVPLESRVGPDRLNAGKMDELA